MCFHPYYLQTPRIQTSAMDTIVELARMDKVKVWGGKHWDCSTPALCTCTCMYHYEASLFVQSMAVVGAQLIKPIKVAHEVFSVPFLYITFSPRSFAVCSPLVHDPSPLPPPVTFLSGPSSSLPQHTNWRLLRCRVELVGRLLLEVYGGCAGSGLTLESVVKVSGWSHTMVSSSTRSIQQPRGCIRNHYRLSLPSLAASVAQLVEHLHGMQYVHVYQESSFVLCTRLLSSGVVPCIASSL